MKNDPTFKLVALAIFAGVIVSLVTPTRHDSTTAPVTVLQPEASTAAAATE